MRNPPRHRAGRCAYSNTRSPPICTSARAAPPPTSPPRCPPLTPSWPRRCSATPTTSPSYPERRSQRSAINAVDDQIRRPHHNETVGILLCTGRNRQVVEYALRGVETPIGVSTYTVDRTALTKELPPDLEQQLPSVGELTTGLQRIVDERASELAVALDEEEPRSVG